jgi:hypothetical protein
MARLSLPRCGTTVPLHLSLDPWWDLLTVLAFGACDDGLPEERTVRSAEDERLEFLLAGTGGPVIGFRVKDPWALDPLTLTSEEVWDGPRFHVPALGLTRAGVGEILLAVRGRYAPGEATYDAISFHAAIQTDDREEAATAFKCALEAGDMKAMFGLGYTLVELGRAVEGYQHLRRYTELVPHNAWAWCWLGMAAEACGDVDEARGAYRRTLAVETAADDFETDATDRLHALGD